LEAEQRAQHRLRVETATNTLHTSENTKNTVTELKSAVVLLGQQVRVEAESARTMEQLLTEILAATNSGNAITRRSIEAAGVA
jgi:hypothetical protein